MMTVTHLGKSYEVRRSPDPRLRCSLCALRGCRGDAPCMDLAPGSYLWTEPVRRPDPPRPVAKAPRPAPRPIPEPARKPYGGGMRLPDDVRKRIAEAGRAGDRADDTAQRERVAVATVYKVWRIDGVDRPHISRPAASEVQGGMTVGRGRKNASAGKYGARAAKPGRPAEALAKIREILATEPNIGNGELAKRLGFSREHIGKVRRDAGLPRPPSRGAQASLAARPGVIEYVREHNAEGNDAIAAALGAAKSTVARLRKTLGLVLGRREAARLHSRVTEEHLRFIREHAGTMTDLAMANALDISERFISYHRRAMGLPPSRKYTSCRKKAKRQAPGARRTTAWREAQMRANPDMDMKGLMALTGMSAGGVSKMRKKLGLPPFRMGRPRNEEEGHGTIREADQG